MGKLILNGKIYTGNSADGFPPLIYSDDEREIGVWTNGKPLYQRTFQGSLTPSAGSAVIFSANDYGIEQVVEADGYIKETSTGYFMQIGGYVNSRHQTGWFSQGDGTFLIYYSELYNYYSVTVKYTKTADVAGSGKWSTNGGTTHHYSTNEQVIGTWIDGKPLYEKTLEITSLSSGNNTISHGITNVDAIVYASGMFFSNANNTTPIPNGDLNSSYNLRMYDFGVNDFKLAFGSGYVQYLTKVVVILQYTKTTD